jgi:hypothetical protein
MNELIESALWSRTLVSKTKCFRIGSLGIHYRVEKMTLIILFSQLLERKAILQVSWKIKIEVRKSWE